MQAADQAEAFRQLIDDDGMIPERASAGSRATDFASISAED